MIIINNVNDTKFSLDGIEYFKNFTPVVQGGKVKIVNTYDSKIELIPLTTYDQITLDSVIHTDIEALQTALLPVLFTRDSLGGGGGGGAVDSVFGRTGDVTAQEGDYSLDQLSDVVIDTPTNNQVLKYNSSTSKFENQDESGGTPYTDEQAQDAVGNILTDTAEIDFTYDDVTPSITASIVAGSIDESKLDTSVNASLDLADTALQSGDNISELVNDEGYIPNTENYTTLLSITGMTTNDVVIVTDSKTGGVFVYNEAYQATNNGGTILNGWMRQYGTELNALWFGIKGDGTSDDRALIDSTIQYAANIGRNIFFPRGNYYFNSYADFYGGYSYGVRLEGKSNFTIYGEKGTKFTSSLTSGTNDDFCFILMSHSNRVFIKNIEFENTHGLTTNHPNGILILGTTSDYNTISDCIFHGFYNAILLNGGKSNKIENNTFLAPLGHDNSANTEEPAVYINVVSHSGGTNRDLVVRYNYAEGYSGTDITTTTGLRAMDGFYYGYADGAIVENNTLLYFCEEAIFALGYETYQPSAVIRPTLIKNNYIDLTLPTGTTNTQNYGIVARGSNYTISDNYIKSGYGILCNGAGENRVAKNVTIKNNKYFTVVGVDHWYPIIVQGYATSELAPAKDYLIENNEINLVDITLTADLKAFLFADVNYINVKNNKIYIDGLTQAGNDVVIYAFAQNCDFIDYGLESITGGYDSLFTDVGSNTNLNYHNPEPTLDSVLTKENTTTLDIITTADIHAATFQPYDKTNAAYGTINLDDDVYSFNRTGGTLGQINYNEGSISVTNIENAYSWKIQGSDELSSNVILQVPNKSITFAGLDDVNARAKATINVQALTSSPADGATAYFGNMPKAPTTTANISKIYFRENGTITHAEIYNYSGTAGTNEAWSLYIRKNNTTDYLIATVSSATNERVFSNTAMSIPIVSGDYVEIKMVNPTWVTNPLTCIFGGYLVLN